MRDCGGMSAPDAVEPAAAQCVFQIMHEALREVVSACFDAADSAATHASPMDDAAIQLSGVGTTGYARPAGKDITLIDAESTNACQDPSSRSARDENDAQKACEAAVFEVDEIGGHETGGLDVLETLPSQPHAVAFVEYVFERMIFGLMQEVVAHTELQADGR